MNDPTGERTLTYRNLGPEAVELVGRPLGCDSEGWPWQVVAVEQADGKTLVHLDPWPIPGPDATTEERQAFGMARTYADQLMGGRRIVVDITREKVQA